MNLLTEKDKPKIQGEIIVYAGRFQPFHKGHYDAYQRLVGKFGSANVYIATSNDTSSDKSPFSFNEKKEIATKMFGVPSTKFVKVSNPYRPAEILKKYDGKTIAYIAAVGDKDATRLQGKYFKPYKGKAGYGYDEIGYTYPIPAESNPISGTDVRKGLGSNDKEKAKKFFLKAYPKFDKDIFKMITTKLNEGFPGGIGVGLDLPGGYINGAPTGSTNETLDSASDSAEYRYEPHPTRHEREHPSDEPDWHKKNEPYDPISELIERYITNEMFEEFTKEYFGEAGNKALDVDISYTDSKGQPKKIKARDALRLPKDHPAHIQAAKIAGPDDAPANEPKKKEEPGKAAQAAAKPAEPGQPVKKGQTAQGQSDKQKSTGGAGEKEKEQGPPPQQKLSGSELKSNAEKPKVDPKEKEAKQNLDKELSKLPKEEQEAVKNMNDPNSESRKSMSKNIGNFLQDKGNKLWGSVKKWGHEKKHMVQGCNDSVKSIINTGKLGHVKNKETGKYEYSEKAHHDQKHALKHMAKDVALLGASMVGAAAIGGAIHGAMAGHAAIQGAVHGVTGLAHHGAAGLATHIGKDLAKHSFFETMGLGGPHAAGATAAVGVISHLMEGEEGEDNSKFVDNVVSKSLEKMSTYQMSSQQMLESIQRYNKQQPKKDLEALLKENISESKESSIQNFIEFATKRLKLKEQPKVNLLSGREYSEAKTSLGGYNPMTKEIFVVMDGRLTADICRTIAHEMVHRKQDEMGLVRNEVKDGADGSPIENQAHAVAGILMREYGRINKQIYNEATDTGNHNSDGIHNNHNLTWKEFDNPAKGYVDMLDGWEVYGHLSDTMPDEVLKAELPVNTHIDPKKVKGTNHLKEDINVKVDKGDTVLMGKFKNKKVVVKDFGKDDHGMPTINGKVATTFRMGDKGQNVFKKDENVNEMGSNDIHFKNVVKYYDKGGPNIKKQVSLVIAGSKNAHRDRIVGDLRNMGYSEIRGIEKKLGIEDLFEKKNLKEVSNNTQGDAEADGGYVPKGKKRVLDGQDGVNKSEEWYTNGGYTQTEFPKADAIFGDDEGEERTIKHSIKNLPDVKYVETDFLKEALLLEGGAYGHMSHPFDDMDLTFGDLKNIIISALTGELGVVREKTDGQALAISWKNGRLIAARNKGHLQNAGANAMGIEDVASKFGGRGGLTDAYNFAMKDLSAAISSLSEAQRKKIFNEGKCFMNLEVIWPTSVNVIPYGQALLVFHNTVCYDEKGTATGADGGAAGTLAGMIKQVNADVQSKYTIQGPPITSIPKSDDLSGKQGKYLSKLKKLQSEFGLSDSDNVADYHQSWWDWWITSNAPIKVDKLTKEALIRRWAFGDKGFRLNTISNLELQKWATTNDKVNVAKQQKDNIKPFEEIFLGVGADVLEFVGSVLTVHPEKAIRAMKQKFVSVASQVRSGGDPSKISKLKQELSRLNSLGGIDKIVASEGIVFFYGGKTYKLTGTFAPLNQILGIFYS
jgi:hypothetical protein